MRISDCSSDVSASGLNLPMSPVAQSRIDHIPINHDHWPEPVNIDHRHLLLQRNNQDFDMSVFAHRDFDQHEQVVFASDPETGLKASIAIHDTTNGPALGGCRMWPDRKSVV